ncbi:MAG: twin-arginine translocation signal domain-containing protein, partial [Verrucomicrobiota bacterium]
MQSINRRSFLKQSSVATAAFSLSAHSWSQVAGANNDIRIGIIGLNGRGDTHIQEFKKMKGARITAMCDVDKNILDRETGKLKSAGMEVEAYT